LVGRPNAAVPVTWDDAEAIGAVAGAVRRGHQRLAGQVLAAVDQSIAAGELDAEGPQQPQRRPVGRVDEIARGAQAGAGYRGAAGPLLAVLGIDLDQLVDAVTAELGGVQR
jgi:hypothetical protein